MVWIQRIVLVVGVIAILAVAFVSPPKILIGRNGVRVPLAAECGTQPKASTFAQAAGLSSPGYEDKLRSYNRCIEYASVDTSLLALYLTVIASATGALVYATRPRVP